MSDRILVMHGGRIRQLGAPEDIYARPRDVFVAEVVGAANFFDVTVRGEEMQLFVAFDAAGTTFLAAQATTGAGVARAMIRPDRLGIDHGMGGGPRPNVLRGWIRQRLFMGGHHEYMVETAAGLARVFPSRVFAEGGRVVLSFEAEDCIFLPGE